MIGLDRPNRDCPGSPVVVLARRPINHVDGKRREAIVEAATIPLLASRSLAEQKIALPSGPGTDDGD